MNSLNLISSRVIGQSHSASRPRSQSQGDLWHQEQEEESTRGRTYSDEDTVEIKKETDADSPSPTQAAATSHGGNDELKDEDEDETDPLLGYDEKQDIAPEITGWHAFVKKVANALTAMLAAIGAPVVYLVKWLGDGKFSSVPGWSRRERIPSTGSASGALLPNGVGDSKKLTNRVLHETKLRHSYSSESMETLTSDSEAELRKAEKAQAKSKREKSGRDEVETRRSSIRIKEQTDPALKRRRQKKAASPLSDGSPLTVDNIKSPTSPSTSLKITRYPHAPQPPRPLIPRRQPSYANLGPRSPTRGLGSLQQKTLVLDLDETLIHSLAKGGRMSSGHMVEVKLNMPVAVSSPQPGQATSMLGPQHPILYYVHKRPHCDEFLRKISKWYKLVVFTASVQEYADPVIDWLEQERKYFAGRYYRQHCTFRNGAYIKDLSSIEPDLSKVMILDNSPVSYIFHEDNAIPIEGWINDPTDNDLLHLIPMLEALQYVTDVRALLALRRGEAEVAT
ncbi:hypothetical protein PV11_09501 [Exophiala sideris]|uniref:FCP1 homology domain-containing protein n=1 Tax=Exophiala sideris TaxID=1016849 RepID=A0A0D1YA74_9EURO|nr:hypothetical protein PV11_09501 [Exophiala sideris]